MTRTHGSSRAVALAASVWLAGCGANEILAQARQCTVDADCAGSGWCQEGSCQTAYTLAVRSAPGPAADAKVYATGVVQLGVEVTGGGTTLPPVVTLSFIDEGRLRTVGPPDYGYAWDTSTSSEGSHRVKATVVAGTRTYESQVLEVVVDRTRPAPPVPDPVATPTRANPVVMTGTAEENTTLTVLAGGTRMAQLGVPNGGTWVARLSLPEGTHALTATATDGAGNTSVASAPITVLVDRTAPAAPLVDPIPSPTNATRVTVVGTAEARSTVELSLNGVAVVGTVAAIGGRWSKEIALPTNGTYSIQATATDAAGNRSGQSPSLEVKVVQDVLTVPTLLVRSPTRASPVPVNGATLAGAKVSVLEGAMPLAEATADAQGSWSANLALAEGAHRLKASATNGVTTSPFCAEVEVVVDRAAPAVVSRTPDSGDTNVWTRDPITVTFSKPMDRSTVGPSTVQVAGQATGSVAVSATVSEDGTVLTILLTPLPQVPDRLSATLTTGITDLAGNALATPERWSWDVPEWQDLANPIASSGYGADGFVAVDPRGTPVLALLVGGGGGVGRPSVMEWTRSGWSSHALTGTTGMYYTPVVDVGASGTPTVVWASDTTSSTEPYVWRVARWNPEAAAWADTMVLDADPAARVYTARAVSIGPDGWPVVAWHEGTGIYVRRLGPAGWGSPWGATPVNPSAVSPSNLTISWMGQDPVVTWASSSGDVLRWTGTGWHGLDLWPDVGGVLKADGTGLHPFDLRIDSSVTPAAAVVRQWNQHDYSTCSTVSMTCPLNVTTTLAASEPALAVDPDGNPVAAWLEGSAVYVKKWTGGSWVQLGGSLHTGCPAGVVTMPYRPRIAVGTGGVVAVLWSSSQVGVGKTTGYACAKRYNR